MVLPNFILPALLFAAVGWWIFFEWLRDRSYRAHRRNGFAPGTQHFAWIGVIGAVVLVVAALILAIGGS